MKMRLVDGVVADLAIDPAALFHPDIAAQFVDVPKGAPSDLRPGYLFDGGAWAAPAAPSSEAAPASPAYRTTMTPIRFKAQFPISAQVKIKRARAYVDGSDQNRGADEQKQFARDVLDVLFGSLDDPRLTEVDVADPTVIAGVEFVQSLGILTPEEAETIKRGVEVQP